MGTTSTALQPCTNCTLLVWDCGSSPQGTRPHMLHKSYCTLLGNSPCSQGLLLPWFSTAHTYNLFRLGVHPPGHTHTICSALEYALQGTHTQSVPPWCMPSWAHPCPQASVQTFWECGCRVEFAEIRVHALGKLNKQDWLCAAVGVSTPEGLVGSGGQLP